LTDSALFAFANRTDIGGADVAAVQAFSGGGPDFEHGFGKGNKLEIAFLNEMQDGATSRTWAEAGKLCE